MCPVNYATTIVRFVFALESHRVADTQGSDTRRKIDIVGDQKCPSGRDLKNKTLVTTALVVIRQNAGDSSATAYLFAGLPFGRGWRGLVL